MGGINHQKWVACYCHTHIINLDSVLLGLRVSDSYPEAYRHTAWNAGYYTPDAVAIGVVEIALDIYRCFTYSIILTSL